MNTKQKSVPEVIATARSITSDGDDCYHGSGFITGVQVREEGGSAIVQLDLRDINVKPLKGSTNLIIEIELHELVSAISIATLNAENQIGTVMLRDKWKAKE